MPGRILSTTSKFPAPTELYPNKRVVERGEVGYHRSEALGQPAVSSLLREEPKGQVALSLLLVKEGYPKGGVVAAVVPKVRSGQAHCRSKERPSHPPKRGRLRSSER